MKKTLILAAAFACVAFSANASLVNNWNVELGSWNPANSPSFATTGIVNSADGNGTLEVSTKKGLYNDYFYHIDMVTFGNANLSVNSGLVSGDLSQVVFAIVVAGSGFGDEPVLNFNTGNAGISTTNISNRVIGQDQGTDIVETTFTWDVAALGLTDEFSVDFSVLNHTPIYSISLSAIAVPEPSTYALIAGAFGLAAVVVARRRRA